MKLPSAALWDLPSGPLWERKKEQVLGSLMALQLALPMVPAKELPSAALWDLLSGPLWELKKD